MFSSERKTPFFGKDRRFRADHDDSEVVATGFWASNLQAR